MWLDESSMTLEVGKTDFFTASWANSFSFRNRHHPVVFSVFIYALAEAQSDARRRKDENATFCSVLFFF